MSVVPIQWKRATILPIPKCNTPVSPAVFRPISITPVLPRILESIVTREYMFPSLEHAPPSLDFSDQYAFQPTGSITAALISILHYITSMLETNQYEIVYAIDFSKAFDSVRHSTLMEKFALLCLPDNIYNWIGSFFSEHSHRTSFRGETSEASWRALFKGQQSAQHPTS
jgi:Reverse transcriptase (RNA-dependent DNA polymerase)